MTALTKDADLSGRRWWRCASKAGSAGDGALDSRDEDAWPGRLVSGYFSRGRRHVATVRQLLVPL